MTPTGACKWNDLGAPPNSTLTVAPVGFYAGLNLIAWFMVFCFVRETKQLTLEELDRKSNWLLCYTHLPSNDFGRGLLGSNIEIHLA